MSLRRLKLEICVDSLSSARNAVEGGADRLEVCGCLGLGGGVTPSVGLVTLIQKELPDIPIMAMVRPRVGDFVYSEDEIKVMLEEIRTFKNLGVAGIVFGVLLSDGSVDLESARRIVKEALPLEITFHRAVDMTVDFESELVKISQIGGISRILTSGGSLSVSNGLPALERVFRQTSAPPLILPGSGVNAKTAPAILDTLYGLGLTELHASGGIFVDSIAKFRKPGMGMGLSEEKEWSVWQTRVENVSALRAVMDHWIKGRQ